MTIKASKPAIAIAVVAPLTMAMTGPSHATPALSGTVALKAAAPVAATEVKYRKQPSQCWNNSTSWGYPAYNQGQGYDPLRGTYWNNVAPYGSGSQPDAFRGTYWDNVAPY
jgi:hypothetical protein